MTRYSFRSAPPPPAELPARLEQIYVCPLCRSPLRRAGAMLRCDGEHNGRPFPLIDGAMPVLVEEPVRYVARACIAIAGNLRANEDWLAELDRRIAEAPAGSALAARYDRIRAAERENRALQENLLALLKRGLTADEILDAAVAPPDPSAYSTDFNTALTYLRRDYSGRPESERELAVLEAALAAQLDEHGYERGSALVLGAGLGRIAWGLRSRFPQILAVDSSPVMAAIYRLLERGPLSFHELNLANARTPADQALPVRAALPEAKPGGQLDFALADASALPVADGSQAAVFSVYFTDVIPPSRLGPEVARVLPPGGLFLHLGPAGWHFSDIAEQVSAAELAERFADFGFKVFPPKVVRNTLLASSASLVWSEFDNLCFAAVKL